MRRAFSILSLIMSALTLAAPGLAWAVPVVGRQPVVVELFTAQGCSACVRSAALVSELDAQVDILTLTFSVGYWDYLGWTDTFAQPNYESRQRAYSRALGLREVYTPQIVVAGRSQASGVKVDQVRSLISAAGKVHRSPPDIAFLGDRRLAIGTGARLATAADVWFVRYQAGTQDVVVKRGDNKGQTIAAHNVVRQLVRLGGWSGRAVVYRVPPTDDLTLTAAVLVQAKSGHILAVLAPPPPDSPEPAAKPVASSRRPPPGPGR